MGKWHWSIRMHFIYISFLSDNFLGHVFWNILTPKFYVLLTAASFCFSIIILVCCPCLALFWHLCSLPFLIELINSWGILLVFQVLLVRIFFLRYFLVTPKLCGECVYMCNFAYCVFGFAFDRHLSGGIFLSMESPSSTRFRSTMWCPCLAMAAVGPTRRMVPTRRAHPRIVWPRARWTIDISYRDISLWVISLSLVQFDCNYLVVSL